VSAADVLVALFRSRSEELETVLRTGSLSRLSLLRYLAHGNSGQQTASLVTVPDAEAEALEVVILNDHYTQMETVIDMLVRAFHMSQLMAFRTMLTVHQQGRAAIGPYARDSALEMIHAARRIVEDKEEPLMLTVQPARPP
jgi:ATP-dependent Clp protease adaptor protein ClpS